MPLPADGTKVKLGKGSLLLDTLEGGSQKTGFDFMGNVEALALAADVTKVEKYSSTERSAPKIAEAVTRLGFTLTATLSEYTLNNLKKFLFGAENPKAQASLASQSHTPDVEEVVPGRYIDTGKRRITNVVVTRDGTDVMVADTDYKLYSEFGIVHLIPGGSILEGDALVIEYDQPALTIDQVRIARESSPICHLLYLSDDANQDGDAAQDRLEIWRVSVAPEGELGVIGDDYGTFQLTMGVLSDAANHPNDPFGTLDRIRE